MGQLTVGSISEGVNVRFAGELQSFIQQRVSQTGLYSSTSEYIRDLVRRDYQQEQERRWAWLRHELSAAATTDASEFEALDAEDLIVQAKKTKESPWPLKSTLPLRSEYWKFGTTQKRNGVRSRPIVMCAGWSPTLRKSQASVTVGGRWRMLH